MTTVVDERWAFIVEYFDATADIVRQYQLLYYLSDDTLEMVPPPPPRARDTTRTHKLRADIM